MSLPFEREQLDLLPEPPERMEKRLSLHVDHAPIFEAEKQQYRRFHLADVRDRRGRVQLRVQRGRQLLALRRRPHAKLGEVPVRDVGARRLRADHGVAHHCCGERVWELPDDLSWHGTHVIINGG